VNAASGVNGDLAVSEVTGRLLSVLAVRGMVPATTGDRSTDEANRTSIGFDGIAGLIAPGVTTRAGSLR
jgi:hypothetical protein